MSKNIILGLCGGIAIYKTCDLISLLKKSGFSVSVIMTNSALKFMSELIFKTLSNNQVYTNMFIYSDLKPVHIELASNSDLLIIAPCTANTLGKLANGISDNLLTSVFCAHTKPVLIAPTMNNAMLENPITQENIKILKKFFPEKIKFVEPETGRLACGTVGAGRLADINIIFQEALKFLS